MAGKVSKIVLVDSGGDPIVKANLNSVVPDDPYKYGGGRTGLAEPPYNPQALIALAERHSTHGAALEQKTADIVASGWEWSKKKDGASEDQRKELDKWFASLADPGIDESTAEILHAAWWDVETIGYGGIRLARDGEGRVRRIYSVDSSHLRFTRDQTRLAKGRIGKRTWFKRWTPFDDQRPLITQMASVDAKTGLIHAPGQFPAAAERADEILVLRKATRRRNGYAVPGYVSAMGWMYLSLAARDDNIHFFNNRREPRWAIILQNMEEDDGELETALKQAFSGGLDTPHKNIFIPIEGDGKIDFQKMTEDSKDISFDRLQERASSEVLLAHRIPPDRLGAVRVGPLGGNATMAASMVYKEAVVATSQAAMSHRINRFIENEVPAAIGGKDSLEWEWKPRELDLTEEAADMTSISTLFVNNILRLDEARAKLKLEPVGEADGGGKFFYEITQGNPAAAAASAAQAGARVGALSGAFLGGPNGAGAVNRSQEAVSLVDQRVREILESRRSDAD